MQKRTSLTAGLLAAALGFSGLATAQPTFHYNSYGGFVVGSDSGFPEAVYNDPNTFDRMPSGAVDETNEFAWGTPQTDAGKSRLTLNADGLDEVVTPAAPDESDRHINTQLEIGNAIDPTTGTGGSIFGYLTHDNNTIDEAFEGATVDINYYLDIYAPDNADKTGDPIATLGVPFQFQLDVWETNNSAEPCPNGDPNPCDDRFRYRLLPGGDFGDDFIDQTLDSFSYDGETYEVSATGFFQEGGGTAGEFWTIEEEDVSTTGSVRIEAHQVPAPAPLGLLGLGLLGLAWLGGRKELANRT